MASAQSLSVSVPRQFRPAGASPLSTRFRVPSCQGIFALAIAYRRSASQLLTACRKVHTTDTGVRQEMKARVPTGQWSLPKD